MSLGQGINFSENDSNHLNGAGSSASPTGPPAATSAAPAAGQSEVEKQVQYVLTSEIGIATMLNRLKQSIASAKEFANFLKKRASIEEDNANGLKRLAKHTSDNMRRSDHLGGSFAGAFEGMMGTHDRVAENGMQYANSLLQMAEDLNELASVAEKQRKSWKQNGLSAEQRVADVDAQMRKSQAKYYSLAEEYDKVRTGDGSKGGKMFGFKGPKSAAQHEEELLRKVQAADQDYQSKVQTLQQERSQLIKTTRPEAIRALEDIVMECDSGLVLQMQKYGKQCEDAMPVKRIEGKRREKTNGTSSIFQRETAAEQWHDCQPLEERKRRKPVTNEPAGYRQSSRHAEGPERLLVLEP